MSVDVVRNAFLLCAVINYVVLIVWFLLYLLPHQWLYRLWARWFRVRAEQFDAINFAGIVLYKVAILLFNLAPYLALRIVGRMCLPRGSGLRFVACLSAHTRSPPAIKTWSSCREADLNEVADATGATRNDPWLPLASVPLLLRTAISSSMNLMPLSVEALIQRRRVLRNQYESTKMAFNTHI